MRPDLELLARLLVDVGTAQDRVLVDPWSAAGSARAVREPVRRRGIQDLGRALVEELVVERLDADPDLLRLFLLAISCSTTR